MLVGTKITDNSKIALDNALTSNLIPQLENLPQSSLGAISALHSNALVQYFKDAFNHPNRQSYVETFSKILNYLQVSGRQRLVLDFANGNLKVNEDSTWQSLQNAYENKKKEFELELPQLKDSMSDLIQSMVI